MGARSHITRYHKHYIAGIIAVFAIAVLIGWGVVSHYKPLLSQRLKQQVFYATDSLYHVNYSEVHLNPLSGKLTLDSFHLIPDTATFHRLEREHRAPTDLFDIFVDKFKLEHIHLWSLIRNRHAHINTIKIENPRVSIYHQGEEDSTNRRKTVREAFSKLITGPLKQIKIGHVGLHNIQFRYKNRADTSLRSLQLGKMDLVFADFQLDTTTLTDSSRFLFAQKVWFHLDSGTFFTEDSLYKIGLQNMGMSLNAGRLTVEDLSVTPQIRAKAFEKHFTTQKDIFRGDVRDVRLSGVYLNEISHREWVVDSVRLGSFDLDIYLDRRLPRDKTVKPLLQELLRKIDGKIDVTDVALHNGKLIYREYNPQSGKTGAVTFNRIHGEIHHITNDSAAIDENLYCSASLQALFMNKGALRAQFKFNLLDPSNTFSYTGRMGQLRAKTLNPATEALGLIKVNSGRIHTLRYRFQANNTRAEGDVDMKYDRLKISILAKDKEAHELKKKGLVSLAANLLVLKEGNVNDSMKYQTAHVVYARDPQRSVFSLMWKSIFEGVKNIVGIDQETEAKLKSVLQQKNQNKKNNASAKEDSTSLFQKIGKFLKGAFK